MLFKGAAATLMRRQDMYVVYLSARLPASQYTAIATQLKGYFLNAYAGEWNVQFFYMGLAFCLLLLIWPLQNDAKFLKNDWNPGTWVLDSSESTQQELPMNTNMTGFR